MKLRKIMTIFSAMALAGTAVQLPSSTTVKAENPIIQTSFTPDPAPVIYGDELWVYTGRDRDGDNDFYYMTGWQAFSTKDMKNWTNHGCILEDTEFSWCNANDAWASQCIERNGKYYFYFTTTAKSGGGRAIGVGVSDNPAGPFKDVLGKPLAGPNWDYIDPTVIIDDDGQAWLMFGNPKCYYVKLNEDMISLDGKIQSFDMTEQAFGTGKNGTAYGEGPWIYKHDNMYYLVYAGFYGTQGGESMCYSYGPSVTGPWTFGGQITDQSNCFTTHGGIIDYKGHSYMFYHMNGLKGGGTFNRSAAVEEFTYNFDGTIPRIKTLTDGPSQIESLNPYVRTECETSSWESGIGVEKCSNGGLDVCNIENGDYVKVSGADFGNGAQSFTASVASATSGGSIEIYLDKLNGTKIGTLDVSGTDGWQKWEEITCNISGATGEHDIYLKFTGGSGYLFNVDWWKFNSDEEPAQQPNENGTFFTDTYESGTNSWSGRGSAKVASSSNAKYQGSKSLYVSGREASWNGASKELSASTFVPGNEYSFSVNVMAPAADKKNTFFLTLQYNDADGEAHYDKIARGTAMGGEWIQLSNTAYKIPADASDMYIYVETESGRADFYIDDATGAEKGTVISGAGTSKMLTPGDVTCDGVINSADISAARKGLISRKFASKTAEMNADADRSEVYEVSDMVLISQYVAGRITVFPDNSPVIEEPEDNFEYNPNLQYKAAPDYYLNPANTGSKIVKETYTGINGTKSLNIYLPAGYDPSKKYNIFYLMHGGGENENTIFSNDVKFNNILDHMIENGDIEPMIVVTPTFNGGNCSAYNVHEEIRKSIVPFVEGKYSTYAEDTTPAGLEASRMHRAYGGFSMGGGTTWNVLINSNDYFAYFMPLSGHCWGGADEVTKAVSNSKYKDSIYILAATGSQDIAYDNLSGLINNLKKQSVFKYTSDFSQGNLYYLVSQGSTHWWGVVRHYVYDALPYFFHEK